MAGRLTPEQKMLRSITEKQLLEAIRKLAGVLGFATYHTHISQFSEKGWPDLALAKPGRVIFAELKSELGKPTDSQVKWLDLLAGAGMETYLWKPADWHHGEIDEILQHGRSPLHVSAWVPGLYAEVAS